MVNCIKCPLFALGCNSNVIGKFSCFIKFYGKIPDILVLITGHFGLFKTPTLRLGEAVKTQTQSLTWRLRIAKTDFKSVRKTISTEENFKNEGRPDKWTYLAEPTKKQRKKKGHWPGQILQVSGQLAASINTYYDNDSAVIGSNLAYAAIHQLGGQAGRNKSVGIPARPYLQLTPDDFEEILLSVEKYL